MELEKLAGLVCPKCGGALEYGFYSRALDPLALVSARKYQDYLCR